MISKYIKRALASGTPLIDGAQVTFVWRGKHAPLLTGDFSDWERGELIEMEKAGRLTWLYTLELPLDAYIEYAYIDRDDPEKRYPDPYNKRLVYNGLGSHNNYFYMPQAKPTQLILQHKDLPRGVVTRHAVETWHMISGSERSVYLYQPPVEEPCPLLVVWDGYDYLRRARLPVIVDNLIAQNRIPPLAMALVHNGGRARMAEYGCSEGTLAFLLYKVLPLAQQELKLIDIESRPGTYAVMGASMGGLMALYTALRFPDFFGSAISQSGAFKFDKYDSIVFEMVDHTRATLPKLWLDIGTYDFGFLLNANRRMVSKLGERAYQFEYHEYPAGHNYTAWRNDVSKGLEFLFG